MKRATPMKRTGRLRPVSPKRQVLNLEYAAAKAAWRAAHDGRCEMRIGFAYGHKHPYFDLGMKFPGDPLSYEPVQWEGVAKPGIHGRCPRRAEPAPHHRALRGKFLCDIRFFAGVCLACHNWIHANPKKARQLGYLIRPETIK